MIMVSSLVDLIIYLCLVRPPDLEVDEDTRGNPRDHDDTPDCPELVKILDENVPRILWALPEDLCTVDLIDCCHCHNDRERDRVDDEPHDVVVQCTPNCPLFLLESGS